METLITFSLLQGISRAQALALYRRASSADALLAGELPDGIAPEFAARFRAALREHLPAARERAKAEADYCREWGIQVLSLRDAGYPSLLRSCEDAPLVLYYKGNAPLEVPHALSVVGTRKITPMGIDLCRHLCEDLAALVPDALIVSGLAYGVDIHAHRNALQSGLPTVGVLAHGLGQIYPAMHRRTAEEMTHHGGLLTEYLHFVAPKREHFVRRNRIVAGMGAGTVVVESAKRGGALITAEIAMSYNRPLMAYPGRPFDVYSEGCNALIRRQQATLVTSARDIVDTLGWRTAQPAKAPIQRELFPVLSPEEQRVCTYLSTVDNATVNALAVATDIPSHRLLSLLFDLEMQGIVRPLAGGAYGLIK